MLPAEFVILADAVDDWVVFVDNIPAKNMLDRTSRVVRITIFLFSV